MRLHGCSSITRSSGGPAASACVRLVCLAAAWLVGLTAAPPGFAQVSPYPGDALTPLYEQAAQHILDETAMTNKGYGFVFGAGEGRLAYEIALRSQLEIIGVEQDVAKVNSGRTALLDTDRYGDRITLHNGSLDQLRYRDYAAVLVVSDSMISDGTTSGSASEMFRMVRPHGGVALIGQPPGCPNPLSRIDLEAWLDEQTQH